MKVILISQFYNQNAGIDKHVYSIGKELENLTDIEYCVLRDLDNSTKNNVFEAGDLFNPFLNHLYIRIFSTLKYLTKDIDTIIHTHGSGYPIQDINTIHGCNLEWLRRKYKIFGSSQFKEYNKLFSVIMEKFSYKHGKYRKLIAVSQMVKNDIIKNYKIDEEKIDVIHNGVDTDFYKFNMKSRLSIRTSMKLNNNFVIFFPGGDNIMKGLFTINKISLNRDMSIIKTGTINFDNKRINAVGYVNSYTMSKLYSVSDVVVLPTIYDSFGLSILEAMSTSRPVIVSRMAGVSEIIKDYKNGIILDNPLDIDELNDKINQIRNSDTLRRTLSKNARKTAEKNTWRDVSIELFSIYKHINL